MAKKRKADALVKTEEDDTEKKKNVEDGQSGRRMSICSEPDYNRFTSFQSFLTDLQNRIAEAVREGFQDYEEMEEITETVKRARTKVSKVDEYRKANPNKIVKGVSFSSAKPTDLDALGVKTIVGINGDGLVCNIRATMDQRTRDILTNSLPTLSNSLNEVKGAVSTKNEAGARMVIDQWLLALLPICRPLRTEIFLWPELCLSSSDDPVRVDFENNATFLTGITDYAIGAATKSVQDELQTISILKGKNEERRTLVLLEAKNTRENLSNHITQAVLQCLALPSAMCENKESAQVSFSLTNSSDWIFGIVNRAEADEIQVYHTSPMSAEKDVSKILDPLFFWATTPSEEIFDIVKNCNL